MLQRIKAKCSADQSRLIGCCTAYHLLLAAFCPNKSGKQVCLETLHDQSDKQFFVSQVDFAVPHKCSASSAIAQILPFHWISKLFFGKTLRSGHLFTVHSSLIVKRLHGICHKLFRHRLLSICVFASAVCCLYLHRPQDFAQKLPFVMKD